MSSDDLVLELLKLLVTDHHDVAKRRDEKVQKAGHLRQAIDFAADLLPGFVKSKSGEIHPSLTFEQLEKKLAGADLRDGNERAKEIIRAHLRAVDPPPRAQVRQYSLELDRDAEMLDDEIPNHPVNDAVRWLARKIGEPPEDVRDTAERDGTRFGLCEWKARIVGMEVLENGIEIDKKRREIHHSLVPCAPEVRSDPRKDLHHVLPKIGHVPYWKFVQYLRQLPDTAAAVEESLAKMEAKFPKESVEATMDPLPEKGWEVGSIKDFATFVGMTDQQFRRWRNANRNCWKSIEGSKKIRCYRPALERLRST